EGGGGGGGGGGVAAGAGGEQRRGRGGGGEGGGRVALVSARLDNGERLGGGVVVAGEQRPLGERERLHVGDPEPAGDRGRLREDGARLFVAQQHQRQPAESQTGGAKPVAAGHPPGRPTPAREPLPEALAAQTCA